MLVQLAAKEGQASLPAMHTCMCPACFTEFVDSSGVMTCKPKCDLGSCDEATGICTATGASGETLSKLSIYCCEICRYHTRSCG